jgi:hypothetical protein
VATKILLGKGTEESFGDKVQESNMHGRSGLINAKNIAIFSMAMFLLVGLHYHSKLRTHSVNQDVKLLQLKEKEENLNENMKAVVETRSECLRNLRSVKNDLLNLKKSVQEKDDSAKSQYESLRKTNEQLSSQVSSLDVKYNNLLADYSKTQSASAKSLKETQDKLQQREEELKILKSEKESDSAKLKDEIANLQRENTELKSKLKAHNVPHEDKSAVNDAPKKQDIQVPAPNAKQIPYPDGKSQGKSIEEPGQLGGNDIHGDKPNVVAPPPEKREAVEKAPQKNPGQEPLQVPLPIRPESAQAGAGPGPDSQLKVDENRGNLFPKVRVEDQLQIPQGAKQDEQFGRNDKFNAKISDKKAAEDI